MPNCIRCRKEIDATPFCPYCGAKQERAVARRKRANGEGTAYKERGGWKARIVIGWESEDEKTKPIKISSGGFPSKSKALEFIPVLKAAAELPPADRQKVIKEAKSKINILSAIAHIEDYKEEERPVLISFRELYEQWYDFYSPRIDSSTMSGHRAALAYFEDVWDVPFAELTADDLQDCIDTCPRGKRTRENMKQLCKRLYEYALGRLMVQINCAEYLYIPKQEESHRAALEQGHVDAIAKQIGIFPFAEYVYCLSYLGFRPNEMLRLRKSDYHNENGIEYFIGGFKTEAGSNRIVTISPRISPIIHKLLLSSSDYIFPDGNGGQMKDDFLREKVFYPLLAKLGIQPVPKQHEKATYVPYSCRHYFSNLLKKAPGTEKEKAALIGHADYETTRRVYQTAELQEMQKITNSF